jgi:hypothetical protein
MYANIMPTTGTGSCGTSTSNAIALPIEIHAISLPINDKWHKAGEPYH